MTYSCFLFVYRKKGLTPKQFQDHYDNVHVPLLQSMAGDLFPISHQRHYIHREAYQDEDRSDIKFPASVILGSQADFGFDCITKFAFKDKDAYNDFFRVIMVDPENSARRIADEEKFMDNSVMSAVAIGDIIETKKVME